MTKALDRTRILKLIGTVSLAALGGSAFYALNLPLPWMLGAMIVTIAAALGGAPLQAPDQLRSTLVAVIGVLLGSGFGPETIGHLNTWAFSIIGLLACVSLQAIVVAIFLVKVGRFDPVTALFSAMPGGLVEMMEIGRQYGGDERAIILAHTARVVLVIAIVAVWFRFVLGYEVRGVAPLSHGETGLSDYLAMFACGLIGAFLGLRCRLPAPTFLGPMLCSAVAHMAGWTDGSPPSWMIICAQVLLGAIVGCRFIGTPPRKVLRAFALSTGATILMLLLALGFAWGLSPVLQQPPDQVLLAYAPGGLTEMCLVALSMGADVAYIASHHLVRVIALLATASICLGWIAQWLMSQQTSPKSRR